MERDQFGRTALHVASRRGDVVDVESLVGQHPEAVSIADVVGSTPLHECKTPEMVRALAGAGADTEARTEKGRTPLHNAVIAHRQGVAEALIAAGADVDARDGFGRTPLTLVAEHGGDDLARALLAAGASPATVDNLGWNCLHFAALGTWPQHESHPKILRMLLDMQGGPSPLAADDSGLTPLHICTDETAAMVLISKGADLDARAADGKTPLHTARGHDVAAALMDSGATIHVTDAWGRTPLHYASDPDKAHMLIARGAILGHRDNAGQTALECAVESEREEVADVLRKSEAANVKPVSALGVSSFGWLVGFAGAVAVLAVAVWCALQ